MGWGTAADCWCLKKFGKLCIDTENVIEVENVMKIHCHHKRKGGRRQDTDVSDDDFYLQGDALFSPG